MSRQGTTTRGSAQPVLCIKRLRVIIPSFEPFILKKLLLTVDLCCLIQSSGAIMSDPIIVDDDNYDQVLTRSSAVNRGRFK